MQILMTETSQARIVYQPENAKSSENCARGLCPQMGDEVGTRIHELLLPLMSKFALIYAEILPCGWVNLHF